MVPQEAWQLLVLDSTFTGRTVDKPTAIAWAEVLGDVSLEDASEALKAYYATERRWIMPADINNHAKAKAKAIMPTTMSPEHRDCTKLGRPSHMWARDSPTCLLCTVVRGDD